MKPAVKPPNPEQAEATPTGLDELQSNKATAFQQIFETEGPGLLRYAYSLIRQRETAQDLVQEAFCKLHASWQEVTNHRAWLFRTIRNRALNHLRDHRRETPLDSSHDWAGNTPDPKQTLDRYETLGTLQLLVAELDQKDRVLIALKYHDNLKYEQISRRTGLSIGNVGYKLHHILKHLADSMHHLGIDRMEG